MGLFALNDDIFLNNKVDIKDFFRKNLPCDSAILNVHCSQKSNIIHDISNNDVGIVNEHFNFKKIVKNNLSRFFNIRYGLKYNLQNLALIGCPRFPGFKQFHICAPLLKSTYEELWDKEFDILDNTCKNKFRTKLDVNQWVMREWQLASNKYIVTNYCNIGRHIAFNELKKTIDEVVSDFRRVLFGKKYKVICINDSYLLKDFERVKKLTLDAFESKYSVKSSFER